MLFLINFIWRRKFSVYIEEVTKCPLPIKFMNYFSNKFIVSFVAMPYFLFVIWWWKFTFSCRDGWSSELSNKFYSDVKIKSAQSQRFSKTCVDSFMIWWSPYFKKINSISALSFGCFIINMKGSRFHIDVSKYYS